MCRSLCDRSGRLITPTRISKTDLFDTAGYGESSTNGTN